MIGYASQRWAAILWLLLALFVLRVAGQLAVAYFDVAWLPPMEEWYSGLIPYRPLLAAQIIIIGVYAKVCVDFQRGAGFFVTARPVFGRGVLISGYVYFVGMVFRYMVRMAMLPDERWLGGCIPIVFHWVLASFIIVFGHYHRSHIHMEGTP
ncbi:MAG: hypothetical protein SGI88_05370 [Candidatus Hydrogenedentes bacterium]|nr:hypothetical protein [Candidatus Hydrogenedentota bacterium]